MFDTLGSPISPMYVPTKGINIGGGKAFFVSGLSLTPPVSDDNEGTDPQYPLATIAAALLKCTARSHDYIFVQDSSFTTTAPLEIILRDIRLIGLGNGNAGPDRCGINGGTDPGVTIGSNGGGFELAGFELGASDGSDPAIYVESPYAFGCHIHHNKIGLSIGCLDGISGGPTQYSYSFGSILHNYFVAQVNRWGINFDAMSNTVVAHNLFRQCVTGGINIDSGGPASIIENLFYLAKDANEGCAITLGASTFGHMVIDNITSDTGDNPDNCPYKDLSAADAEKENGWAKNYAGNEIVFPQPHV